MIATILGLTLPMSSGWGLISTQAMPIDSFQPHSTLAQDLWGTDDPQSASIDLEAGLVPHPLEQFSSLSDRAADLTNLQAADSNSPDSSSKPIAPEPEPEPDTQGTINDDYGRRGQGRWYIQGGVGIPYDPEEANFFGLAGAGVTHFFANGHSINAELNSLFFSQSSSDAVGINLGIIGRWHFIRERNWSLYVDGGVGIIGTTSSVPPSGTEFNFTPQVGGGATIQIAEQRRLLLGLRWHHISNANLFDNNPGQNAVLGYVGLDLPR